MIFVCQSDAVVCTLTALVEEPIKEGIQGGTNFKPFDLENEKEEQLFWEQNDSSDYLD